LLASLKQLAEPSPREAEVIPMPAVDPARLEREIETLMEAAAEPQALTRRVLDLLEFYAERARRTAGTEAATPYKAFGVPRPVVRGLGAALRARLGDNPEAALAAASALWGAGYRETQFLAASILGVLQGREAAGWAAARAETCPDAVCLAELARSGLAGWRAAEPQTYLAQTSAWLRSGSERVRALGATGLTALVDDASFEDLPAVFRLLTDLPLAGHGVFRRALEQTVDALARRSPPEAARFLLDALRLGTPGAASLARRSLPAFPARQRGLLEEALSEGRGAGIIPPSQ
jgi:hypothetical protein